MSYQHDEFITALMDPQAPVPENFRDPSGKPAGARFNVYRNNVMASLLDAMKTAFPVVQKLIGSQNFQTLAIQYIRAHPPKSPMLMFYGEAFEDFIAEFTPLKKLPYLPDIAKMEMARREVYHAKDMPAFEPSSLQDMGQERFMMAKMVMTDSSKIIQSPYPIYDIWLRNSGVPDHPISQNAQDVLLTRPLFDVQSHPISRDVSQFLLRLKETNVQSALEESMSENQNFPFGDVLNLIVQSGIATRFE